MQNKIYFFKRRHKIEDRKAEKYYSSNLEPPVFQGRAAEKEMKGESLSRVRISRRGASIW